MSEKPVILAALLTLNTAGAGANATQGLIVGARYACTIGDDNSVFSSESITPKLATALTGGRETGLPIAGATDAAVPLSFAAVGHFEFIATRPLLLLVPSGTIESVICDLVLIESPPTALLL
jgi:hypothetical protein